ncbi:hypothetical protein [Virgibacillus siamensis]|uniref:hypothetical protein n=1 Tax=Virgibacillus siamensis TaxID=480071 RepID=UPI000984322E|nr:hypothetical protein [Virgibacillus siamensis]
MSYDAVFNCIKKFVELEEIVISPYPNLPFGLKIIDKEKDYIIFFYDTNTMQVIYLFKDAEDCLFRNNLQVYAKRA